MIGSRRRTSQPPNNLRMADVAKLAGVSESTVSRALKDSPLIAETTRERIRRLADEAGYAVNPVASSLRSRQTCVITVAVPLVHEREPHLVDPFMMTKLGHLADALSDRGADFDGVMAASDVIVISAIRGEHPESTTLAPSLIVRASA